MSYLLRCVCILVLLFSSTLLCFGQIGKKGDSCETVSSKLDFVGSKYTQVGTKQSSIILIGFFPDREKKVATRQIMSDAVKYLTKFHDIASEKIVSGTSLSATDFAELHIFVNGELTSKLKTNGASRLCFGIGETFP